MLQNWLKPLGTSIFSAANILPTHCLGRHMLLHADKIPNLKGVRVALIGVDEKEANAVREVLYRHACPFPTHTIADLGNLRRPDPAMLIPVVFELLSGKVLPVLLAQGDELARAQFLAYQEAKSLVNLAVIDERPRLAPADEGPAAEAVYTPLLQPRHPLLFHFGLVGFQSHQTAVAQLDFLQQQHSVIYNIFSYHFNNFTIVNNLATFCMLCIYVHYVKKLT